MSGFDEVLGNEEIIKHFRNVIQNNKESHAYILNGEKGMGKKLIARLFASALLCDKDQDRPCMECRSCSQISTNNHPDIIHVTHEKPNSIGVDEIRVQVNNSIIIKPYSSQYKIYIIDEAEKLTPQAQNSLLKTIEEPPAYAVIILLTTNADVLLPTIISRCVLLNLRPLDNNTVREYVKEHTTLSKNEVDIIVAFSNGNIGKAMRLASSEQFSKLKDAVLHLLKHLSEMEVYEVVLGVKNITEFKMEVNDCIDLMMTWFRDVLLYKVTKNLDDLIYKEEFRYISEQASKASYNGIETILLAMEKTKTRLNANVNFDLAMELMFLTIKENIT